MKLGVLLVASSLVGCLRGNGTGQCYLATNAPTVNYSVPIGKSSTYGPSVAQSFIVAQSGGTSPSPSPSSSGSSSGGVSAALQAVTVTLSLVGSFPAEAQTLTASIEADTSGPSATVPSTPSGTAIFTSTLDPSAFSKAETAVTFPFPSATGLSAGQIYWLVLTGSWPVPSAANGTAASYVNWWGVNSATTLYQSNGITLPAKYLNVNSGTFQNAAIGTNVSLFFILGC